MGRILARVYMATSAFILLYSPFLLALFSLAYQAGGRSAGIGEGDECE